MEQDKSKSNDYYSIVKGTSVHEEDQLNLDGILRQSTTELPISELSGDEAIEKSFMQSMGQSSIWAKRNQKANLFLSSIQVMKSMVGVGILGIPDVAKNFGVLLTMLLMAVIFSLGVMSSNLLLKSKNLSKHSNYSTIGFFIFRHRWIIMVVNLVIIFANLGVVVSELIIFGDTMTNVVNFFTERTEQPFYLSRTFFIILVSILIYPLIVVKSIEKLRFVSLTAIMSISTFSILVVYNFFAADQIADGFTFLIPDNFKFKSAMASLPTVILAFNWQFNLFPVFKGMQDPTDKRLLSSVVYGFSAASVLYLTVGILGYATYGQTIQTNYLNSIKSDDVGSALYVILNLTFVVSSTLTMPVIFFGGRNNFIQLLKSLIGEQKQFRSMKNSSQLLEHGDDFGDVNMNMEMIRIKRRSQAIKFYGVSTGLFTIICIAAIFIHELGLVYNLLGAICCNAIQLGLPTLFYFKLVEKVKRMRFENKFKYFFYYFVKFMFIVSLFMTVLCVVCEFIK